MRGKDRQTVGNALKGVYDRMGHFRGVSQFRGTPSNGIPRRRKHKGNKMISETPPDLGAIGTLVNIGD